MSTPSKRSEMRDGSSNYDFNGLKAHISRCLLRQISKRIVMDSSTSTTVEEAEYPTTSSSPNTHHIQRFYGALLFVDISGFTALSTRLDIESLTTHINGYFKDMLSIIESFGGDVVKFFGDAMYIVWHAKSFNERQKSVVKAVACAKEIVRKCNGRTVPLSPRALPTSESIMSRVALLSGQNERDHDPNSDTNDDDDDSTAVHSHLTFLSDDLESQDSPRSPRVRTHRRRNSQSSQSTKPKVRRLSFPSFMLNKSETTETKDSGVASLNVHIGASVGVLAGIDVAARGRSEFFLTGQPLLDVSAAEGLAKLGQIVVSKGVYEFLKLNNDLHNTYECVSEEFGCYRITEPIVLSFRELELQYGPAADVRKELASILNVNSGSPFESTQRATLLKCLSSHVHEAARMQSPSYSRPNSPPHTAYTIESLYGSSDNNSSGMSSVYSSTHSDDSSDYGIKKETTVTSSYKFERKLSFDNGLAPDDSLSAELRELVILFIKIEVDVSLTHSSTMRGGPESQPLTRTPSQTRRRGDSLIGLEEIHADTFKTDNFGFLERCPADEAADVALQERFQECMSILADTFAEHGGQIGQYSCCEKGNVCLGTFGLRGSVQEDNAAAAIESAQTILFRLQGIGLNASIGVTSGKVYSGLVGSPSRHEYSIMGPAANLSSRLMCAAAVGTILSDNVTRSRDRSHLFLDMPMINAKGYSEPVKTYQPVMSDTFRRRLYSRKGSMDSWNDAYRSKSLADDADVFGMMAIEKLAASRNPTETFLFGRDAELKSVVDFLLPEEDMFEDYPSSESMKIAIVTGACGCGKTCFLASVREIVGQDLSFKIAREKNVELIFSGGSNSYDTTVPFNSWRPVLTALISAVSRQAKSDAAEVENFRVKSGGKYNCRTTFSTIEHIEIQRMSAFSPAGLKASSSVHASASGSPQPPSVMSTPLHANLSSNMSSNTFHPNLASTPMQSCNGSPSRGPESCDPLSHRFNHLRNGCVLIAESLPFSITPHLNLVSKILPSFTKVYKGARAESFRGTPKPDSTLSGAARLQKTVEVLSAVIQAAVNLLRTRRIFITLDDVQSLDPSSWNLLTYMWRHNTAISVLASFHSLSRSSARGKVIGDAGEIEFFDFSDTARCKVVPLPPLEKQALSQLVAKMLETSALSNSQIAIITEAAVDLAAGNPLFAREITISAVETFNDTMLPDVAGCFNSEALEEATISHVINTLRPRHRIEEIIALRFDRLTPSYQLVLKLASVVGKDGASFTADIISHLVKELTSATAERHSGGKSSKYPPKLRTDSLAIVNLNSINVEETLKTIMTSNEFIRVVERSSHSSPAVGQPAGVVKYKFKNVLIKKSVYDLMLNHQKLWSHQKVAEYLEAQALARVTEMRTRTIDDSDDDFDDAETASREGGAGSNKGSSDCGRGRGKDLGSIADWNMLGVHWRLCNNLIKAMACFYESGHLVDSQGDCETARLLWTEAYEILCLMRKDSKFLREASLLPYAASEKAAAEEALNRLEGEEDEPTGENWGDGAQPGSPRRHSLGSMSSREEKSFGCDKAHNASECVYHVFKGDSLALEVAVTLIIRLSQNVLMFEEQPEDVANLNNEALELVSCTRSTILEQDAVTFIHVPRLSPVLFLKGSSLLGHLGSKDRRQSITLKDGKRLFCLRDPSIIFPVLSGLCMRYSGKLLPDDRQNSNWAKICEIYLATANDSKIPVHMIRALSLKSLFCFCNNQFEKAALNVDLMSEIYSYQSHSEQLIHIYGADRALMQYLFGAISCIMIGDFRRAITMVSKTEEHLESVTHLQSVVTTSLLQFNVYLLMQMNETAYSNFISLLSFLSFNGGHHNMFHPYIPLYAELGKRLGHSQMNSDQPTSTTPSPYLGVTRRGSTTSTHGSVISDLEVLVDLATLGDSELESLGYTSMFDYKKLLECSRFPSSADAKMNPVPVILALRYGKGIELVSAELCLLEAKRLHMEASLPSQLERNFFTIEEEPTISKSTDSVGGPMILRSAEESGDTNDSIGVGVGEDYFGPLKPDDDMPSQQFPDSGSARDFCEAGIRFIDYSFEYYPIHDSTLNSLQCFLTKAGLLVTLAKIKESERSKFRSGRIPFSANSSASLDLLEEADKNLCSALELGATCNFQLSILLVGIAYVQLGINVAKGKCLIHEFMLFVMKYDQCQNGAIVDVSIAMSGSAEHSEWMETFPLLVLAMSLLRGK